MRKLNKNNRLDTGFKVPDDYFSTFEENLISELEFVSKGEFNLALTCDECNLKHTCTFCNGLESATGAWAVRANKHVRVARSALKTTKSRILLIIKTNAFDYNLIQIKGPLSV